MKVVTKAIRDLFNANNFMEISQMEEHDMIVSTGGLDGQVSGPATRVYNLAGSGKSSYNALYLYLSALADIYGKDGVFRKDNEFDFNMPMPRMDGTHEVNILDTNENQIFLRIANNDKYFGFQTYQKQDGFENIGPMVWVSKQLPIIHEQAQGLDAIHKRAKPQPFTYELAA